MEYMKEHLFSVHYQKVLAAMEMCTEKPEVKILDCNTVQNFAWLEQEIIIAQKRERV